MKAKDAARKTLKLETLTPKRVARMKLSKATTCGMKAPPLGMRVTLRFGESNLATTEALGRSVLEMSRRCGPRHTAERRARLTLSKGDLATLKALEPEILKFIAASPENAALYAFDPLAALPRIGKGVDPRLLGKLRALAGRSGSAKRSLPKVSLSRVAVEVQKGKTIRPPKGPARLRPRKTSPKTKSPRKKGPRIGELKR